MVVFRSISDLARGNFAPVAEPSQGVKAAERRYTLYSAVAQHFGIGHSDSVLSARNHNEIARAIAWVYSVLDEVVGARSQPWAMQPERTEEDVVAALDRAGQKYPTTPFDAVTADIRAGNARLPGRGKPRSAVACEAVRVSYGRGVSFAAVIAEVATLNLGDMAMVEHLEQQPGDLPERGVDWATATAWASGYGLFLAGEPDDHRLCAYCTWLFDDWTGVDDSVLLGRLIEVGVTIKETQRRQA